MLGFDNEFAPNLSLDPENPGPRTPFLEPFNRDLSGKWIFVGYQDECREVRECEDDFFFLEKVKQDKFESDGSMEAYWRS
jgi:hypothetical protein